MEYIYEKEQKNYEDFASGRVLYNQQGTTAFPVRLASEIFQRCVRILEDKGNKGTLRIYDPCCGGAYLLTTLGFLHGSKISEILGSDIDDTVLDLAERNLKLLTTEGIQKRMEQIQDLYQLFSKQSHKEALESACKLHKMIEKNSLSIKTNCFKADALKDASIIDESCGKVDLVITDVPYGKIVDWEDKEKEEDPAFRLLDTLRGVLSGCSAAAVISDKKQTIHHPAYRCIKRLKAGKRQVFLFELNL